MSSVTKDILEQLDVMTDEELIKALENCTDYGLGDLLGNPAEFGSTLRREELSKRMNEKKLECRQCKGEFLWEGDMVDPLLQERVEDARNFEGIVIVEGDERFKGFK